MRSKRPSASRSQMVIISYALRRFRTQSSCLDKASNSDDKLKVIDCNSSDYQWFHLVAVMRMALVCVLWSKPLDPGQGNAARTSVFPEWQAPVYAGTSRYRTAERWAVLPWGDGFSLRSLGQQRWDGGKGRLLRSAQAR